MIPDVPRKFSISVPAVAYGLATVFLAWLLMQGVHECGHVLGAWTTGGSVTKVVLHPLTISRTDVFPNPSPRWEIWAGPLGGSFFPLSAWMIARRLLDRGIATWLRFFAGFCLIANGAYLGYGIIEPIGDADELVRHGTPIWMLLAFAFATIPTGLLLWNGLGPAFGWGLNVDPISWKKVSAVVLVLILVIALETRFGEAN